MNQQTHKRLYHWHSLAGLITTLLLVALCLTALPSIFISDLNNWLLPNPTESTQHLTHDQWIDLAAKQLPLEESEFHYIPNKDGQAPSIWMSHQGQHTAFHFHEGQGFIPNQSSSAIRTLAKAHHNFLIPDPYGEYVVGLVGLSMLALVFMGVLLHKKWRKEKTQMRRKRSERLFLSDIHKLLGLWLLPFHLFISYTGAVLGLGRLLLIVAAISAFNGDQEAAIEAVIGAEPIMTGEVCATQSIESFVAKNQTHWQNLYGNSEVLEIEVHGLTDCNGQVTITSSIPGYLLASNALSFSITSGEIVNEIDWIPAGVGERWYALIGPLHYGTFAGYLSQWIFAISTLLLIGMIISGMLLWLNKQPNAKSTDFVSSHGFVRGNWGIAIGVSLATAVVLFVAKYGTVMGLSLTYDPTLYHLLYGAIFLASLLSVYFWSGVRAWLLSLTAGLFAALPIFSWLLDGIQTEHLPVDITLLGTALAFVMLNNKYPVAKQQEIQDTLQNQA